MNRAQLGFDIDAGNPNGIASCSPRLLCSATCVRASVRHQPRRSCGIVNALHPGNRQKPSGFGVPYAASQGSRVRQPRAAVHNHFVVADRVPNQQRKLWDSTDCRVCQVLAANVESSACSAPSAVFLISAGINRAEDAAEWSLRS